MDGPVADLDRGRAAYAASAWLEAYESLVRADQAIVLGPDDLEALARAAYMLGRDDGYVDGLERAHRAHLGEGDIDRAVRCAFWLGHHWLFRGEAGRGSGWFARGQRLLGQSGAECVEAGYLMVPVWLQQMVAGDFAAAYDTLSAAVALGERFGDTDLTWLARDEQGRALFNLGRLEEGLRLLDEVLVVAAAGELSPIVTGIVY